MSGSALRLIAAACATFAVACGGEPAEPSGVEETTPEAPAAAAPAPAAPAQPVVRGLLAPAQPVAGAPLPDAFPSDLLYPNAERVAAGAGDDGTALVIFETHDGSETIVASLRDRYAQAGWDVQIAEVMEEEGLVYASKGEVLAMVTIQKVLDGDKTSIQIATMPAAAPGVPRVQPAPPVQ